MQGPCKENQEYLINTKVIELFNKIMEETCIDEDEDKEKNENENEQNLSFYLSNKNNDPSSFFSENITYIRGGGTDEDLMYEKKNSGNKIFSSLSDYEQSMLLFKISLV